MKSEQRGGALYFQKIIAEVLHVFNTIPLDPANADAPARSSLIYQLTISRKKKRKINLNVVDM